MKLRNKFMSLALAAAMVITTAVGLTPATAHAAGATVALVPQKTEVNAGDTVVVDVKLSGNTGMTYLKLNYTYDKDAFEFVSAADQGVLNGWVEPAVGTLLWKDSLAKENNTANGTIATLTFTVKEGAEGTKNFGLTVAECYDSNMDDVALSANGTTVTIAHVHTFGDWTQTAAPGCETEGTETRTCGCGESETRPVAATGHTFGEWTQTAAPGCETEGTETRTCACGKSETRAVAPTGHTFGEWTETVAPGCETAGSATRECACGKVETKEVPATGHTYGEWTETVAPGCETVGEATRECACGHVDKKEVPAVGHVDADKDGICDACKKEMPKEPVKPGQGGVQTGDSASVMTWIVLMAVAAGAVVVINKKRINA